MPSQDLGTTQCPVCRASYPNAPPDLCPRCGADNRTWRAWRQAGWRTHLRQVLLRNPWGRPALVSLLLPVISWGVFGFQPFAGSTAILLASLLTSLAGLLLLFLRRDTLWTAELARRVSPRSRAGLLTVGGAGFLLFIVVGILLMLEWGLAAGRSAYPEAMEPAGWVVGGLGITFTILSLACGLYSVYAYGRWLARSMPAPIFWDEAGLLSLVEPTVKRRLEAMTDWAESTVVTVVEVARTDRAGLNLRLRLETATNESFEGFFLRAVQHWQAISDQWGHIRRLSKDGPLEYAPDPDRPCPPPVAEERAKVLEGELIFPERQSKPALEEAILTAFNVSR